jgi:hypothetical protein
MRIFRILDADGKEWRFHKMKFEEEKLSSRGASFFGERTTICLDD